jgi:hypothetical protein
MLSVHNLKTIGHMFIKFYIGRLSCRAKCNDRLNTSGASYNNLNMDSLGRSGRLVLPVVLIALFVGQHQTFTSTEPQAIRERMLHAYIS